MNFVIQYINEQSKKKKDGFTDSRTTSSTLSNTKSSSYNILYTILSMFAIFLSFKCNNGFSFSGLLGAFLFPFIYIPYKLATSKNMCELR